MRMKNLHCRIALTLFIFVNVCSCQVSAFQCDYQFSYVGCAKPSVVKIRVLEKWQFNLAQEQLSTSVSHDTHLCNCVMKATKMRYKHIALFKTALNKIACYGVRFGGSPTLMANTVIDNQSQNNNDCYNAMYPGDVFIGDGKYYAIYSVTSSTVTLPKQTTTTVKTMLLTSTTRKALSRPPRPSAPVIG